MFLIENYEDEDIDQDQLDEDESIESVNLTNSESNQNKVTSEEALLNSGDDRAKQSEQERNDSVSSLVQSIKKHEEIMRRKFQNPEFRNEIEEISIRDLFIKDAVKLTYEQRKAEKDTYQTATRRRKEKIQMVKAIRATRTFNQY